ncbi:VlpC-like protein (plasmid) [Borrelia hermsii HS1]|nr:VlpC-like protein [Borrelia hermsii HS1]
MAKETTGNASVASKDGTIAGGMALRAMSKNGNFANGNDAASADVTAAVKGTAISVVTKALDTLNIAIRKTIDSGLKTVKETMEINLHDIPISPEQNTLKLLLITS